MPKGGGKGRSRSRSTGRSRSSAKRPTAKQDHVQSEQDVPTFRLTDAGSTFKETVSMIENKPKPAKVKKISGKAECDFDRSRYLNCVKNSKVSLTQCQGLFRQWRACEIKR